MQCQQIIGEEAVCHKCHDLIDIVNRNVDIGDGFLYDICGRCGQKRKKTLAGEIVEELSLAEMKRKQANKDQEERREHADGYVENRVFTFTE